MTLLTLTLLKSKGPRLNAKILRETGNVAATKIPLAGQDQRERGLIDAGLFGNLGLRYPFCFDQMASDSGAIGCSSASYFSTRSLSTSR